MIESIMYFGIGFLVATLLGLLFIPLVHNRAMRHRLLVRRHRQFAGRLACLPLGGADLGAQRVGFEL